VLLVQVERAELWALKVLQAQVESVFKAHRVLLAQVETVEQVVFKAHKAVEEPQVHKVLQVQVERAVL
jgi:hypothetical protein